MTFAFDVKYSSVRSHLSDGGQLGEYRMRRTLRLLQTVAASCLLVAACANGNSTEGLDVPKGSVLSTGTAALAAPLFNREDLASFRLERIVVALGRRDVIAHYPHRYWKKWQYDHLCNIDYGDDAKLEWGAGPKEFGNWSTELGEIFFDAMKGRGANVVGDTAKLFDVNEGAQAAEFLVGARITKISGNICDMHDYWYGRPLYRSLGEFYVKVEWEIFSSLSRRVVGKFASEGFAETRRGRHDGAMITFTRAFEAAVNNAAANPAFLKILMRQGDRAVEAQAVPERLALTGQPQFRRKIAEHIGKVQASAVTIDLGSSHGSGFLVSRDGHLLTNAHVVGDGKNVPVAFRSGVRVNGTVLRVAPRRDVALVKVPVSVSYILPLRRGEMPRIGDDVYVVGSPFDPSLRSTVTKGIVSALRTIDGQRFIQADAAVTPGNSGGPLVDGRGNVIGITVQQVAGGENLNFFIPIDDALKALNLTVVTD